MSPASFAFGAIVGALVVCLVDVIRGAQRRHDNDEPIVVRSLRAKRGVEIEFERYLVRLPAERAEKVGKLLVKAAAVAKGTET